MANVKKYSVFVIMPFSDDFFEMFEMLKSEFGDLFEFSNAAEEGNQTNILKDIIQPIYESDIVIADLTGLNPNVMYELGLAHTFNKKTIIITRDSFDMLPFDLKSYRAKDYSTHFKKFSELIDYLRTNLNGAVSGNVVYSNPVKDFLSLNKLDNISWFADDKISVPFCDTDSGFLDFIADIEVDVKSLTGDVDYLSTELAVMNNDMNQSVSEIERVQKSGGGEGIASFARKEAKKVAGSIEKFSSSLSTRLNTISESWDKTEKNILGLLESEHFDMPERRDDRIGFLRSLKELQNSTRTSNESIVSFQTASMANLGFQRQLNQAIRSLDSGLSSYLLVTGRMITSIDKILKKSKLIVGEIDFEEGSGADNLHGE